MRFSWQMMIVGICILMTVFCCSSAKMLESQSAHQSPRRVPKPLDISVPIGKIGTKLDAVLKAGLNVTLLVETLLDVLSGCLTAPPTDGKLKTVTVPVDLVQNIGSNIQQQFENRQLLPSDYCSTDEFETIHNFLWKDDIQFRDYLKFMHNSKLSIIFPAIKKLYTDAGCPQRLIDEVPVGPEDVVSLKLKTSGAHMSFPLDTRKSLRDVFPYQAVAKCGIMEVLGNVLQTGILELFQLLETVLFQINTDPSLQFLIGKTQEPIKGQSFRTFRRMSAVRELESYVNKSLKEIPAIADLLGLLGTVTGLDFQNINILETIINVLEALLWNNFDVIDPQP